MTANNKTLMQRRERAVPRGVGQIHPLFIQRAENATVWDVEGRQYIDFAGGIAVLNTGHRHPKILDAVRRQLELYTHTCFQVLAYEPYVELCERINALVPGDFAKKTLLVTTGSEALENALKIARTATGRAGVIAFAGGYHGRTMMTLAMTGKVMPYAAGMGLMPSGVFRARFPDSLHGISEDDAIESIEQIFKNDAEPQDIAALVIEPVQGEGGFRVASPEFLQRLRELCDVHGIVMIADEVQTGAGRTGTFFAMEQMGVIADLTTFAKSVAGGFPLAGVCGRTELMDAIAPGGLGGTYAGNPVSCAAALAVLDIFDEENLLQRSVTLGRMLTERLQQLASRDARIAEVRGLGAMVACELSDADGRPNPELTARLVQCARDKGLILLSCGQYANVIRILVPLTATDVEVDEGMDILAACFDELK